MEFRSMGTLALFPDWFQQRNPGESRECDSVNEDEV